MQKPIMNPKKVYFIQNRAPEINPQNNASLLAGSPSPFTMDRNPKYRAIVRRGKHNSSVLPPKLNILIEYTTPRKRGVTMMEAFDGEINNFTVFHENTAKTEAAIHSIIQTPTNDFSEIRAAKVKIKYRSGPL